MIGRIWSTRNFDELHPTLQIEFDRFFPIVSGKRVLPPEALKTSDEDARDLYNIVIQTIAMHLLGNGKRTLEVIEILKAGYKGGILLKNGKINYRNFLNYIHWAAREGYIDLARDFYRSFVNLINNNPSGIVPDFAEATILHFEGAFESAKRIISKLKEKLHPHLEVFLVVSIRSLSCFIYYELRDFDQLLFEVNSYRTYLSRNAFYSHRSREGRLNFLNAILKLERAVRGPKEKRISSIDEIKIDLNKTDKIVYNKPWLLSKIEEEICRI